MRRVCSFIIFGVLLILFLSGCEFFMGDDGNAYLKIVIDTNHNMFDDYFSYGWQIVVDDNVNFPENWQLDTLYRITAGTYDIDYNLCICKYDYEYYDYYVNHYSTSNYWVWDYEYYQPTDVLSLYLHDGGSLNSTQIRIQVERGELFVDGDDRDYTLSLNWDPYNTDISSRGIALDKTVITEGDSKIFTFTDGYMTFTMTVPDGPVVPVEGVTSLSGETR